MQVNVSIGQNHHFALHEALLIYRSTEHQNGSFGDTVAKEPRKHSERACRQHLVDEWLLPFKRLRRTATGQRVLACLRIRNLRIKLCNSSQPDRAAMVCGVQRLKPPMKP
jgi:hypothetical protein